MGSIHLSPEAEIEKTVNRAIEMGINFDSDGTMQYGWFNDEDIPVREADIYTTRENWYRQKMVKIFRYSK